MSLMDIAQEDLNAISVDTETAFGRVMTITDPSTNTTEECIGRWSRIGENVDPDTGYLISATRVSFSITEAELTAKNLTIPEHIESDDESPWVFLIDGQHYKVVDVFHDISFKNVTGILEIYKDYTPPPDVPATWLDAAGYDIAGDVITFQSGAVGFVNARTPPQMDATTERTGVYFSFDPLAQTAPQFVFAFFEDVDPTDLATGAVDPSGAGVFFISEPTPGDFIAILGDTDGNELAGAPITYDGSELCVALDPDGSVHFYKDQNDTPFLSGQFAFPAADLVQFTHVFGMQSYTIVTEPAYEYAGVTQYTIEA